MKNEKYDTMIKKILQGLMFAAIILFFSWAFASATVGELITF